MACTANAMTGNPVRPQEAGVRCTPSEMNGRQLVAVVHDIPGTIQNLKQTLQPPQHVMAGAGRAAPVSSSSHARSSMATASALPGYLSAAQQNYLNTLPQDWKNQIDNAILNPRAIPNAVTELTRLSGLYQGKKPSKLPEALKILRSIEVNTVAKPAPASATLRSPSPTAAGASTAQFKEAYQTLKTAADAGLSVYINDANRAGFDALPADIKKKIATIANQPSQEKINAAAAFISEFTFTDAKKDFALDLVFQIAKNMNSHQTPPSRP